MHTRTGKRFSQGLICCQKNDRRTQCRLLRCVRGNGCCLWPHPRTLRSLTTGRVCDQLGSFVSEWGSALDPGERALSWAWGGVAIHLSGRITRKREASKTLFFYDVEDASAKVQIMLSQLYLGDCLPLEVNSSVRRGDVVHIFGCPFKTKTGELSLIARRMEILAPCKRAPRTPAMLFPRTSGLHETSPVGIGGTGGGGLLP